MGCGTLVSRPFCIGIGTDLIFILNLTSIGYLTIIIDGLKVSDRMVWKLSD